MEGFEWLLADLQKMHRKLPRRDKGKFLGAYLVRLRRFVRDLHRDLHRPQR